jgi:transcriptional regulator with XRE-family HTH domain
MYLHEQIKRMRERKKLTQEEVADKCGITRPYLSNIELGKKLPSFTVLMALINVLECNIVLQEIE